MKKVAIIMGSDSDLSIMQAAAARLEELGIPFSMRVISAHRTPDTALKFAKEARDEGYAVLIAAAGKAAHLAGILASSTTLPVIGVPIKASALEGIDALLSTVQMPEGVPVATVAINGAGNAALLAAQIMALSDPALQSKLENFRDSMRAGVEAKDRSLSEKYRA